MGDRPAVARRRGRPAIMVAAAIVVMALAMCAVTARLFIWPRQDTAARADAIVMLDGSGNRLPTAERLAKLHRAPVLVVSRGAPLSGREGSCPRALSGITVICFNPDPPTTRGEAEYIGRLASSHHWRSVIMVASTPQLTPARIWLARCYSGAIYPVGASLPVPMWPFAIAYEWGATVNAEVVQRSC
jgi:uncharacterized SAM-binding protein YcdF (DUF218 family)